MTSLAPEAFARVAEATTTASTPQASEKIGLGPLVPGQEAICIGCGKCRPCDGARVAEYLSFSAHPSDEPSEERLADATTTSASAASTITTTDAAEPTYYLADEINDAINGQNQDIIPLVVEDGNGKGGFLTLLATMDFKLTENYISRRILKQLSLLKEVKSFPKGVQPHIAYLSHHQDKTTIDADIVLDFVTGNDGEETWKHFSNVRFQVYGKEDDDTLRIPDVIIGEKFLREVGGLTVFPRFKTEVESDVRVVYPAHSGRLDKDAGRVVVEGKRVGHDEL